MIAWVMKTRFAIRQIEKWSYDYIKMDCDGDKCYGVLAVRVMLILPSVHLTEHDWLCRYTEFASRLRYFMRC